MAEQIPEMEIITEGLTFQIPTRTNISHQEMVQSAKAMEKNAHFQVLSRLPMDVRKRLRALRKLQMKTSAVEMEFHEREFELEKEFQIKHEEIFKKRFEIITGIYEPNDEDCDVSDPDILKRIDENTEIIAKLKQDDVGKKGTVDDQVDDAENVDIQNESVSGPVKGVPHFWFYILYTNPTFDFLIHKDDEPILRHLIDVRTIYKLEPHYSFTIEFEFSPNSYFENTVLTKEYLLKMKSDDLMSYEGPAIYKTIGSVIMWKIPKISRPSIFDFFNPPLLPENDLDPSYEEIKNMLENDFEIGDYIKDNIVPKAVLYFTGERNDSDFDSIDSKSEEDGSDESGTSDVEDQFEGGKVTK